MRDSTEGYFQCEVSATALIRSVINNQLTEREKRVICGLEAIGVISDCTKYIDVDINHAGVFSVEEIMRLYDEAGDKQIFEESGNKTPWTEKVCDGPFHKDLDNIRDKLPIDCVFCADFIQNEIDAIIRRGF